MGSDLHFWDKQQEDLLRKLEDACRTQAQEEELPRRIQYVLDLLDGKVKR